MYATLERIEGDPNSYHLCGNCGRPVWYEHDECPMCFSDDLKETNEKSIVEWINNYVETLSDVGTHVCGECEIEV